MFTQLIKNYIEYALNKLPRKKSSYRIYTDFEFFSLWKLETLDIKPDAFRYNHAERFHIKKGKWYFNDYFDMKINRDAMNNSEIFIRDATPHEIERYNHLH